MVSWKIEAHPGRGPLEPPAKRSESTGGVLNEDLQAVDGGIETINLVVIDN